MTAAGGALVASGYFDVGSVDDRRWCFNRTCRRRLVYHLQAPDEFAVTPYSGPLIMEHKIMRTLLIALVSVVVAAATGSAAIAAASPAEKACSAQWADLKKANKVPEGQTWPKFWSECSKDFAAKNPTETPAAAAKPDKAPAPEKAAKEPKETKKTAAVDNDTPNANQQKHDCDAKWDEHKTSSGAHGWHDYFKFMAGCM
jgi:hypothetical protein